MYLVETKELKDEQIWQERQPTSGSANPCQDRNHPSLPPESRRVQLGEHLFPTIPQTFFVFPSTMRLSFCSTRPGRTLAWLIWRRAGFPNWPQNNFIMISSSSSGPPTWEHSHIKREFGSLTSSWSSMEPSRCFLTPAYIAITATFPNIFQSVSPSEVSLNIFENGTVFYTMRYFCYYQYLKYVYLTSPHIFPHIWSLLQTRQI